MARKKTSLASVVATMVMVTKVQRRDEGVLTTADGFFGKLHSFGRIRGQTGGHLDSIFKDRAVFEELTNEAM